MRRVCSKQRNVRFFWCASPITIDKRADWGPESFQKAPNGAFLKTCSETEISHLVQPNKDASAPMGWVPGSGPGLFDKAPIWIDQDNLLQPGNELTLQTLDGVIQYVASEVSIICYNDDGTGRPNETDVWSQPLAQVKKNYEL